MNDRDKPSDTTSVLAFAGALAERWRALLGDELLGVYLIGSLAHGGFSRRYSDIDVALTAATGMSDETLETLRASARAISPELASSLSLFWADRHFSLGRFPPLDRIDYLDHAVTLWQRERVEPPRPSHEDIRACLRGAPFENWAKQARRFAESDVLEPKDHKPFLRALLYPARLIYSWRTGRIASNDVAVAHLQENAPVGLDVELVARALQCRRANRDPVALFAERKQLAPQIEACRRLLFE